MESIEDLDPALFDDLGLADLRARLTTGDEEYLARTIEAGVLARVASAGTLDEPERRILVVRGDLALQRFMAANLGLVAWVVSRERRDPDPEELFQEGVLGLDRAVRGYDYRRGGFAAYASHWIRQAVLTVRARRVERSVRWYRDWRQVRSVEDTLTQTLGRVVSAQDVAEELHQPQEWVRDRQTPPTAAVEPDMLLVLADDPVTQDEIPLPVKSVSELLAGLDFVPRRLVQLRFGIGDGHVHTRKAAAAKLGISEKQAARIEAQALEELRGICPQQMGEYLAA